MKEVTDPTLLRQLESGGREVTDPDILQRLEGQEPLWKRAVRVWGDQAKAAGQAALDIPRLMATGITGGYSDKLAAGLDSALTGRPYEERLERSREITQEARDRAGGAGLVAEAGAQAYGIGKVSGGLQGVLGAPKTLGQKLIVGGLEGAGAGAVTAAGNDKPIGEGASIGALAGVGATAAGQAVGAIGSKVGKAFRKAPAHIPSAEDLATRATAAYKAADDAGVIVSGKGLEKLKSEIREEWTQFGFRKGVGQHAPAADFWRVLEEDAARGNITLKGLDGLRQVARSSFDPNKPAANKMLEKAVKRIDKLIDSADDADFVMGDRAAGAAALKEARSLWHRMRKSETVEQAIAKGRLMADTNASGGNTENEVRKQIRQLVTNPKKTRGWTEDEMAAAIQAAKGSPVNNTLRSVGRLGIQGNGVSKLAGLFGIGEAMGGNPYPLMGTVAGSIAKPLSTKMSGHAAEDVAALMRAGGREELLRGPATALEKLSKTKREALARALLSGELSLAPYAVGNAQP